MNQSKSSVETKHNWHYLTPSKRRCSKCTALQTLSFGPAWLPQKDKQEIWSPVGITCDPKEKS